MGRYATTPNADSENVTGSGVSPTSRNTEVTFRTSAASRIYVGDYEARSTPVADTFGSTKLRNVASFTPGTYNVLVVSPRNGAKRFAFTVTGQSNKVVSLVSSRNLAGAASGAKVLSSHTDEDAGSRFTALRSFALAACVSGCGSPTATWRRFYTSAGNAFHAVRPRPTAPSLNLRTFRVPPTRAAALRLVVLENQCTGFAGYAGEQDNDPINVTDCKAGSDRGTIVHVAELQAFTSAFTSRYNGGSRGQFMVVR